MGLINWIKNLFKKNKKKIYLVTFYKDDNICKKFIVRAYNSEQVAMSAFKKVSEYDCDTFEIEILEEKEMPHEER